MAPTVLAPKARNLPWEKTPPVQTWWRSANLVGVYVTKICNNEHVPCYLFGILVSSWMWSSCKSNVHPLHPFLATVIQFSPFRLMILNDLLLLWNNLSQGLQLFLVWLTQKTAQSSVHWKGMERLSSVVLVKHTPKKIGINIYIYIHPPSAADFLLWLPSPSWRNFIGQTRGQ